MASCEMNVGSMIDVLAEETKLLVVNSTIDFACTAFEPEKIIKSGDRTIVFWKDNSKTIVKRDPEDADNLHTAFCAALAKKIYGSNTRVKKIIDGKLARTKAEQKMMEFHKKLRAYKHKHHTKEIADDARNEIFKEVYGFNGD